MLAAALIPTAVVRSLAARKSHRARANDVAETLMAHFSQQYNKMQAAIGVLDGFVSSAAPLPAPTYFGPGNATSLRATTALRSGTAAGAFSAVSYRRVASIVRGLIPGYRNAAVQPGGVMVFTEAGLNVSGEDWLTTRQGIYMPEYEWIVSNAAALVRPPVAHPVLGSSVITMVIRSPVFTNESCVVRRQPALLNTTTGHHPNWQYLWGAVAVVMDVKKFASSSTELARIVRDEFDWRLESRAIDLYDERYPYLHIHTSLPANHVDDTHLQTVNEPAESCMRQKSELQHVCFTVAPRGGKWAGRAVRQAAVFALLFCAVAPLLVMIVVFGLARLIVGSPPHPLDNAPTSNHPLLHAVCVDLPDANRLWSEVPFIMHDVIKTFGDNVDALAAEHRVFVTMRLGCTAVAVSGSRQKAVAFARAFAEWAQNFSWPPHIVVHCPRGSLHFAVMLHTMDNVTVRIDREQGQCEVTGDDMKALLLLGVAAVEQHVMCTGEFLGLPRLAYVHQDYSAIDRLTSLEATPTVLASTKPAGSSAFHSFRLSSVSHTSSSALTLTTVADHDDDEDLQTRLARSAGIIREILRAPVGELGVCHLPIADLYGKPVVVRGFLVATPATTDDRNIEDVLDSLPDQVWAEWQPSKVYDDAGHPSLDHVMAALAATSSCGDEDCAAHVVDANPLQFSTGGGGGGGGGGGAWRSGSSSASLSRSVSKHHGHRSVMADRQMLSLSEYLKATRTSSVMHLNNVRADKRLAGSALRVLDATDTLRKLADSLSMLISDPVVHRSDYHHRSSGGSSSYSHHHPTHSRQSEEVASPSEPRSTHPHTSCPALDAWPSGSLMYPALSIATYYLTAYRIVFAPLEPSVRWDMVGSICAALGVPPDDYACALAARCTRLQLRFLDGSESAPLRDTGSADDLHESLPDDADTTR